jgi:hypothetical protein
VWIYSALYRRPCRWIVAEVGPAMDYPGYSSGTTGCVRSIPGQDYYTFIMLRNCLRNVNAERLYGKTDQKRPDPLPGKGLNPVTWLNRLQDKTKIKYDFLQKYWWFVMSLLADYCVPDVCAGGIHVELLSRKRMRRSFDQRTRRKWELPYHLVTFGVLFCIVPLFYSNHFGGAYWAWMILLFCFECRLYPIIQSKPGISLARRPIAHSVPECVLAHFC